MPETQVETKWKRKNKIRFHRFPQDEPETQFSGVKFFFIFPKWKRTGNELVNMETNWKRTRKSGNEWKRMETNWKRMDRAEKKGLSMRDPCEFNIYICAHNRRGFTSPEQNQRSRSQKFVSRTAFGLIMSGLLA